MVAKNTEYAYAHSNLSYVGNRTIKYIVVHYTGTEAAARNNCIYFASRGASAYASADFFIAKDGTIFQYNPNLKNYYSWHCGDGDGAYGITNYNSIGIEVVSGGKEYTTFQKEALHQLIEELQDKYKVPSARVVRHYDASRKWCPAPYCGTSSKDKRWKQLHTMLTTKYEVGKFYTMKRLPKRADACSIKKINGYVGKGVTVNIVEIKKDPHNKLRYGRLKNGTGWVCMSELVRYK